MKHLYRSQTNKVFGGVCGGLGDYLGLDPVIVRLIVALGIFFTFCAGIVFYFIACLIIPMEPFDPNR